jgi:hypothetical protein
VGQGLTAGHWNAYRRLYYTTIAPLFATNLEEIMDEVVELMCPQCGRAYRLGYDGVMDGCDECQGVKRDKDGFAWHPDEKQHTYAPVDGSAEFVVTREEAFGGVA